MWRLIEERLSVTEVSRYPGTRRHVGPLGGITGEDKAMVAMFEHFRRFPWVLPEFLYDDQDHLLASLVTEIIEPAEAKVLELRPRLMERFREWHRAGSGLPEPR